MSIIIRRSAAAIDGDTAGSNRPGCLRGRHRFGKAALVVASGTAAVALAGPMGLRPFMDIAEAAGAAGQVTVAFVIDFGTGAPVVGCVGVPASDNRYDALSAFLVHKGMTTPRYDSNGSGLLCAINAVPSDGCGQISAGHHYIYWSYFTGGTSGWIYASSGAFGTVATQGDVEGWRFQNPGTGNPGDPGPRFSPKFDAICAADSTTNTSAPTTTTTTQPRPSTDIRPQGNGTAPAPVGSNPTGGTSTTTSKPTTTTTKPSTSSSTSTTLTTLTTSSTTSASAAATRPAGPIAALNTAGHASAHSGPGPGPLIIGGLLITALGIAAFARWRKRPRSP